MNIHFLATNASESIQTDYSDWIKTVPQQLGYNTKDGNQIFNTLENKFLHKLAIKYSKNVGIEESELLKQLKDYYSI